MKFYLVLILMLLLGCEDDDGIYSNPQGEILNFNWNQRYGLNANDTVWSEIVDTYFLVHNIGEENITGWSIDFRIYCDSVEFRSLNTTQGYYILPPDSVTQDSFTIWGYYKNKIPEGKIDSINLHSVSFSNNSNDIQALYIENGFYENVLSTDSSEINCAVQFEYFVTGQQCQVGGYSIKWDSTYGGQMFWYMMQTLTPDVRYTISDTSVNA